MGKSLSYLVVFLYSAIAYTGEYHVHEHIVLTQDITVSASRLCQDGQSIFFISKNQCEKAKGLYNCTTEKCDQTENSLFSCDGDLKIAPIRSVEKISLNPGGKTLTRFYEINTQFKFEKYLDENGKMGALVLSENRELPFCENVKQKPIKNIVSSRLAEGAHERELVESLVDGGYPLVSTPHGNLRTIRNLYKLDEASQPDITKAHAKFQTPFCNKDVSDDQIWMMSGEYTGNGVFQVRDMQSVSKDMFIEKVDYVTDPVTGEIKKVYDFTCEPTMEI